MAPTIPTGSKLSVTDIQNSKSAQFHLLPKVINAGIAGIIGVTCVFPLDLVKTRLQNQQIGPNGEKMYNNMFDCFKKTYRAEGLLGMYRGSAVNIVLITPEKAIKLAANDYFRYHLTNQNGYLPLSRQMQNSGRISAKSAKTDGKAAEADSATKVAMQLLREKGILGLYKGIGATGLRDVTFSAIFFPLFAELNALGPRRQDGSGEAVFWWSFLCGLASGSCSAFIVTPLDMIKTRLQALKTADGERQFHGMFDVIKKTMQYEGLTAFFKGGFCRVIVISPLFAIAQMVYYLGIAEYLMGIDRTL